MRLMSLKSQGPGSDRGRDSGPRNLQTVAVC